MAKTDVTESVENVVVERAEPKRKSVTLTAGGESLTFLALRRRNDAGTVFAVQTNLKTKKTQRGMTKQFDRFQMAVEAL